LLRPRTINFDFLRLGYLARANVADNADDLDWGVCCANEQRFADWIFISENLFRTGLTNQENIL
jgi:hypothetical protein